MRTLVSIVTLSLSLSLAAPAWAQQPTPDPAAPDPAAIRPVPPAEPPSPPPPVAQPTCRLAGPPPPVEPGKPPPPSQHSPMRQVCEDELIKDHDWWWNLVARLRVSEHNQTAREIRTNKRHVVYAYAAMWLLAVGFILIMWRRQQAMKAEITRLEQQLRAIEEEDAKRKAKRGDAAKGGAGPTGDGEGGAA